MRVMIVVTHLLGTGHLSRMRTIGRAFAAEGHDVTLVSGGKPVPHLDFAGLQFVQLPPVASDGTNFTQLIDSDGKPVTKTVRASRLEQLLALYLETQPDVLITELFPFGRRILRDEFTGLLELAKGNSIILSSVRDILAPPSKPAKADYADAIIAKHYDAVLVHADPEVITLDKSWPVTDALSSKLCYTGFVAPPAPTVSEIRQGPVLVSAGGGVVGDAVFEVALAAAREAEDFAWHLLVSGTPERRTALQASAPGNVRIEGLRPDFRDLMAKASMSVSMCGYNTVMDVLQTGVPAVLVPFDDDGEVEQSLRAEALTALPATEVLRQKDLTSAALLAAMDRLYGTSRAPRRQGMDGAEQTVRIVEHMIEDRHG